MTPQQKALWQVHISTLLLAGNGYFAKRIALSANDIIAMRGLLGASVLLLFVLLRGYSLRFHTPRHAPFMMLLGVMMGVHWITFFHSMQVAGVAVGMIALYSYPVFVVFMEPMLHGQRPHWQDILAALAVVFGVCLMVPTFSLDDGVTVGIAWGLFSAFLFAARNTLQRHYLQGYPGEVSMLWQGFAAGAVALPFMSVSPLDIPANDWGLLLILAVFFTAVAHAFFASSLRVLKAKTAGLIGCLGPVYSVPIAWLTLGEMPGFYTLLGGSIILAAAAFETRRL